jgi:hypothetical protein
MVGNPPFPMVDGGEEGYLARKTHGSPEWKSRAGPVKGTKENKKSEL